MISNLLLGKTKKKKKEKEKKRKGSAMEEKSPTFQIPIKDFFKIKKTTKVVALTYYRRFEGVGGGEGGGKKMKKEKEI